MPCHHQANEVTGDFYAVSKLMDHSSPDITLRYVAETGSQKRKVAEALNGVLAGAFEENQQRQLERQKGPPVPQCPAPTDGPNLVLIKSAS